MRTPSDSPRASSAVVAHQRDDGGRQKGVLHEVVAQKFGQHHWLTAWSRRWLPSNTKRRPFADDPHRCAVEPAQRPVADDLVDTASAVKLPDAIVIIVDEP